jgi:hypothetical protein
MFQKNAKVFSSATPRIKAGLEKAMLTSLSPAERQGLR